MFEGVKVAEFAWVGVGPFVGKMLATYGATVVRVESNTRPDPLRTMAPYKDNVPGVNRSGFFALPNANKYDVALNLQKPQGREIARRLIRWADVVTESYTPGTMAKWGLDYAAAKEIKPDIIYLSTSMQGQTGPYNRFRGFGFQMAALSGFYHLTGFPESEPVGPYGAYSDFIASLYNQIIAIAALMRLRKTGKGMYVDLSQLEASIHFLTPALLDWSVNRRVQIRAGNKDPWACPHDVYPCQGEDSWLAIAVLADREWERLCRAIGAAEWLEDSRFQTFASRKQNEAALDALIAEKTRSYDAFQLASLLQADGVRAGVVEKMSQVIADPYYAAQEHYIRLPHTEMGDVLYSMPPYKLSKSPHQLRRAAPCLGEHTEQVLREFLQVSDEEMAGLIAEGVLE